MNCSVAHEMLGPFFDGELDANAEILLRVHLSECEACSALLARLQMRRDLIRSAGLSFEAPPALEARIRKGIRANRRNWPDWRSWAAVAAAVLIASTVSIRALQQRGDAASRLNEQVISDHVRALMTEHTTDVVSTDRHTVKPWFNGRVDFSPTVNDLAQEGFPLIGGRIDYVRGQRVAALVYHRRKHVIDLFVWPAGSSDADGEGSSKGYNVIRWTRGGMFFVAVSDLNKLEMEEFQKLQNAR
jgi:anti-sigma factor RsiW